MGGGPRLWSDELRSDLGIHAGVGLTAYPVEPLVIDLDANLGMVGLARIVEASSFLGVVKSGVGLRAGYRALFVGEVNLGSPMVGLAMWL